MNTMIPQATQTPAQATPAVCTMAAPGAADRWILYAILWSYSATPTGGSLTIAWTDPVAGAQSYVLGIPGGGIGQIPFFTPLRFPIATAVTITLASGAGSVVGSVYPQAETGK